MATRAELARYAEERDHSRKPAKAKKTTARTVAPDKTSITQGKRAKKATYKLEEHADGQRPSRKSTRKSANHVKSDTNMTLRNARAARAPETRARKPAAVSTRARAARAG